MFRKIALSLCFVLFSGLLSSCSPTEFLRSKNTESKTESSATQPAENTTSAENAQALPRVNDGIGAPVALPPDFGDSMGPPAPGQSQTEYMPNGLPALQPMKGVNVDDLFSENLRDEDARFDRLENAVLEMRKEFESVKPSIVRLAATEADIQSLVREMEAMLQETPPQQGLIAPPASEATLQVDQIDPQPELPPDAAIPENSGVNAAPTGTAKTQGSGGAPVSLMPAEKAKKKAPNPQADKVLSVPPTPMGQKPPEPAKPEPAKKKPAPEKPKAPQPKYDGIVAKDLRIGEHGGKVRVVLDVNQKTPFSVDLDNEEKLIIIELPQARWVGTSTKKFTDSLLLDSYTVESTNGGKGSMIVLSLKKTTQILKEHSLLPDENPNHRIYVDLKL